MSRIEKLPPADWDPRLREAVKPDELSDLEQGMTRFFAHCPEQALVRLRIAFFNQCRSCMAIRYSDAVAEGVTEGLVCSLERPQEASDLSAAEKAAIRYGELLATDHLAIGDAHFAELRLHFSEAEIVELGMTAAFFVGFGRLAATWHMVEDLPEAFRRDGPIAPWGEAKIEVR